MKIARLVPLSLLVLVACKDTAPKQSVPLEAPDVHFEKAIIVAAMSPENRKEVEDFVAAEIHRRRPHAEVISSWKAYPDFHKLTEQKFASYVSTHDIDIVVTIVPFAETAYAKYDDFADVSEHEFDDYVEDQHTEALVGRFGVQVVGWDVKTKQPVYAKTSQILAGEVAGPRGVADFAVATVTRER